MTEPSAIIAEVCDLLASNQDAAAGRLLQDVYPFEAIESNRRQYSIQQMTDLFVRDGFIDRYRGSRLVFPPTLRLISEKLPQHFPYHPNWKMSVTHRAFWELSPTVDHIRPVALGGNDDPSNWATCSMLTNSIKANWTLEELGWQLLPAGDIRQWDGLLSWFVAQMDKEPQYVKESAYFRNWLTVAQKHVVS